MVNAAPWWAGVLMALLQVARVKYPDLAQYIEAIMVGLASHWGFSILNQTVVANGQREVANNQRSYASQELAANLSSLRGGAGGTGGTGGAGGGAGGTGGAGGERGTGGRFGGT